MKSSLIVAGFVLAASALLSTVAQAQKTKAGYDKKANFSNYKTFAFDKSGARNPIVSQMIVAAVQRELTSRGLTQVDSNPDLRVVYLAASGFNLQVSSVPFYTAVNPAYSDSGLVGGAAAQMWDVTTGTLLIDLFDSKAERTVFRGTAQDVLQRSPSADAAADAKMVSKQITKGVAKIFKKYPISTK